MRRTVLVPMLQIHIDAPGGSTRVAWDEASQLARMGHDVWAIGPDVTGRSPEHERHDGIQILRYPLPAYSAMDPRRTFAHQRAVARSLRTHLKRPIDVVHGHAPLQYAGAVSTASPRTRLVFTVHSPVALEAYASAPSASGFARVRLRAQAAMLRRLERQLLDRSHVVHVLSAYTERLLMAEYAFGPERVTRIPGWVDIDRFKPVDDRSALKRSLAWPSGRVLFTLRRLVPRMGLDLLLRAFCEIRKTVEDVNLVIAGGGPLRGSLESLAAELGVSGSVRFEGRVSDAALPAMYAAADAFVLPTAELECFGLIALESFASGRPVLATPVGAIPEVVGAVEPRWLSAEASAPALTRLLSDWLAGRLPVHSPADLRSFVENGYTQERRLSELISAALGDSA